MRLEEGLKSSYSYVLHMIPENGLFKRRNSLKQENPLKSVGLSVNPIDFFSNQVLEFLENLVGKLP